MLQINKIHKGDCMELMQHIPDKSVDMILCDLPYGTTACEWDKVLPLDELWKQYKRILKEDGVVVLTASQPFTTDLINSNRDWFKYSMVWIKNFPSNYLNAKREPLRRFEDVIVFHKGSKKYFPILKKKKKENIRWNNINKKGFNGSTYGKVKEEHLRYEFRDIPVDMQYPDNILEFDQTHRIKNLHPTQKPVSLFRYLIKTYTNEGELVLDNCIGSGTTAVACKQANRKFIGIELSQEYVDMANKRLQQDNLHAFFQTQGVLTKRNKIGG